MFAIFQSAGNIPFEKDLLNNTHNEVDNSSAVLRCCHFAELHFFFSQLLKLPQAATLATLATSYHTNREPLNKLVNFSKGRQRCSAKDKLMK